MGKSKLLSPRPQKSKQSRQKRPLKLMSIKRSPKVDKKFVATFIAENGRSKQVHFGAKGYQNYGGIGKERHLDLDRKKRYIARHQAKENWSKPDAPGTLSRYILWNKDTFNESLEDYRRRFKL